MTGEPSSKVPSLPKPQAPEIEGKPFLSPAPKMEEIPSKRPSLPKPKAPEMEGPPSKGPSLPPVMEEPLME